MSAALEVNHYDVAVVEAVITQCGGDARGAVKALLCANELLEADLAKALQAASLGYRRLQQPKRRPEAE